MELLNGCQCPKLIDKDGVLVVDNGPLLDYKFNVTVTKDTGRELLNYGNHSNNGKLYFGRGVVFNGVDQEIVLDNRITTENWTIIVSDQMFDEGNYLSQYKASKTNRFKIKWNDNDTGVIQVQFDDKYIYGKLNHKERMVTTVVKMENGILSIYENGVKSIEEQMTGPTYTPYSTPIYLGSNGNGVYGNGIINNVIVLEQPLTDKQIAYQYSHPEKFLYSVAEIQEDGSKTYALHSEILAQEEIGAVVSYLPMCETDGYVRDMVGYSENAFIAETFDDNIDGWKDYNSDYSSSTYEDGRLRITMIADSDATLYSINKYSVEEGVYYKITATAYGDPEYISSARIYSDGYAYLDRTYINASESGATASIVVKAIDSSLRVYLAGDMDIPIDGYVEYDDVIIEKLTSTYQITNYTNSCRDEALQLTYGMQTCFLQRDSLGVPSGSSFDRLQVNAEKCPLYFSLTDTELHEANNGNWQIEMVISREYVSGVTDRSFYTRKIDDDRNFTGINLIINKSWNETQSSFYFYQNDGSNLSYQTFNFESKDDNNPYHIVLQHYDDNTHELFLNGDSVSGKKTSDFVPSGNSFVNLYQKIFNGELRLLRFHTTPQDNTTLYNEAVRKGLLDD